jgi:hypothetical protein
MVPSHGDFVLVLQAVIFGNRPRELNSTHSSSTESCLTCCSSTGITCFEWKLKIRELWRDTSLLLQVNKGSKNQPYGWNCSSLQVAVRSVRFISENVTD